MSTDPPQPGDKVELEDWPVCIEVPVAWGEMDAYQHLNNTVYLRHFETVRVVYFERIDLISMKETDAIGGILSETRCRFKAPVTYPDRLLVVGRTIEVQADRFKMAYEIHSTKLGRIAAEGDGTIVIYDYDRLCKTAMPKRLRERIRELESR